MNKNRLIETLRIERARWDMLLVQVDSDRMTVPGVVGEMSMRDILADVVRHEKYAAWQLKRASLAGGAREASSKDYWQAGKSVEGITKIEPAGEIVRRFAAAADGEMAVR